MDEELKKLIAIKLWIEADLLSPEANRIADIILTLIREAGWRPPEEVEQEKIIAFGNGKDSEWERLKNLYFR